MQPLKIVNYCKLSSGRIFFSLFQNSRLEHSGTKKRSGESSNKEQSMGHNSLKR